MPRHRRQKSVLYDTLVATSSDAERRRTASAVIRSVQSPDEAVSWSAAKTLRGLCDRILDDVPGSREKASDAVQPSGEFPPRFAAELIEQWPRVRAYLKAIGRAPADAETGVEVGPGPLALYAAATAFLLPGIRRVDAWELNAVSAASARRAVEVMGLAGRVFIHHGDALQAELPAADVGVTETFAINLIEEPGGRIVQAMAQAGIRHLIPAWALTIAADDFSYPTVVAGRVDLANEPVVHGSFPSTDAGRRHVWARVELFDSADGPVLTGKDPGAITLPLTIGQVDVASAGDIINYRYPAGKLPPEPYEVWSVPAG